MKELVNYLYEKFEGNHHSGFLTPEEYVSRGYNEDCDWFVIGEAYEEAAYELRREAEHKAEIEAFDKTLKRVENILDELDITYEINVAQSTSSWYFNCEYDFDDEDGFGETHYFKVRVADHNQVYDADFSIDPDGLGLDTLKSGLKKMIGLLKK